MNEGMACRATRSKLISLLSRNPAASSQPVEANFGCLRAGTSPTTGRPRTGGEARASERASGQASERQAPLRCDARLER